MSIRQKLLISIFSAVLTIAALAAMVGYGANKFSEELRAITTTAKALRNHTNGDMMHDALRADVYAALYASTNAPERRAEITDEARAHGEEFLALLKANGDLDLNAETRSALAAVDAPLKSYIETAQAIVTTAFAERAAAVAMLPDFDAKFSALEKAMENAGDQVSGSADAAAGEAEAFAGTAGMAASVGLLVGLSVGAVTIFIVLMGVIGPLRGVTTAMIELAKGDLDFVIPAHRKDEIGDMVSALLVFREAEIEKVRLERDAAKQREALDASRRSEEQAKAARQREAEEQRALAEAERGRREAEKAREAELVKATMEVLAGRLSRMSVGDLECRIDQAFDEAFEQIRHDFNNAIDTLSDTLGTIVESAQVINERARELEESSEELTRRTESQAASLEESAAATTELAGVVNLTADGATKTKDVISAAKRESTGGADVVKKTVEAMAGVRESSVQINRIIGVVDEIAFQTNLLALNAGVEAARAGDAGRGFAVVATEVRALAQRSAEAAREIKTLISRSSGAVEDGFRLVTEAGEAIERMMAQVSTIDTGIADIATRSIDQATTLKQVNVAIGEIDQATQKNAAMAEHATAACSSLARESARLRELLGRFRIDDGRRRSQAVQTQEDDDAAAGRRLLN